MIELGWHQKEFQLGFSFVFIVVSLDEQTSFGNVYVFPASRGDFDAEVYTWVRKDQIDGGLGEELFEVTRKWIAESWPFERVAYPGREIDWEDLECAVEGRRGEPMITTNRDGVTIECEDGTEVTVRSLGGAVRRARHGRRSLGATASLGRGGDRPGVRRLARVVLPGPGPDARGRAPDHELLRRRRLHRARRRGPDPRIPGDPDRQQHRGRRQGHRLHEQARDGVALGPEWDVGDAQGIADVRHRGAGDRRRDVLRERPSRVRDPPGPRAAVPRRARLHVQLGDVAAVARRGERHLGALRRRDRRALSRTSSDRSCASIR